MTYNCAAILQLTSEISAAHSHFISSDCVRATRTMGVCNRPNLDDLVVLCHVSYDLQLQVKESILFKHKPELNKNIWSLPLVLHA